MSIISRIKRLWVLSGTISDVEDEQQALELKKDHHIFTVKSKKKRKQRLATVLQDDPIDLFPAEEESENNNDKTS